MVGGGSEAAERRRGGGCGRRGGALGPRGERRPVDLRRVAGVHRPAARVDEEAYGGGEALPGAGPERAAHLGLGRGLLHHEGGAAGAGVDERAARDDARLEQHRLDRHGRHVADRCAHDLGKAAEVPDAAFAVDRANVAGAKDARAAHRVVRHRRAARDQLADVAKGGERSRRREAARRPRAAVDAERGGAVDGAADADAAAGRGACRRIGGERVLRGADRHRQRLRRAVEHAQPGRRRAVAAAVEQRADRAHERRRHLGAAGKAATTPRKSPAATSSASAR